MSLFSSKSEYSLGIDFGTQSIKAVELKMVKGKAHLVNYGWVDVTNVKETPDAYDSDYAQRLKDALGELLIQMKPHTKKATVAIPSFNGLVMVIDFPRMNEKELSDAMKFEAQKYIPASLDEVKVSWEIIEEKKDAVEAADDGINQKTGSSENMKVLLVAAPKSEVQYYDSLFEKVSTSISTLELESFSLVRSVIGNTKGRFVLVDFGAKTTNIVFVEDGLVSVNRSVDIGGVNITNAIMQGMNISREKAVSLKKNGENYFSGPAKIGFPSLSNIGNEIKRVLSAQRSNKIEELVLCGGGAELVGLPEFFEKMTGLKVVLGNPLSHIVFDEEKSGNIKELGNLLSVSIGLALRDLEDKK